VLNDDLLQAAGPKFLPFSSLPARAGTQARFEDGIQVVNHAVLGSLFNLQSLIIMDPNLMPQLQQRVDGNSIPLPFFTNSLKRIYIPLTDGLPSTSLLARSVVWIMVHCPTLRKAAFAFTMSTHEDFNFLSEFKSTFKGLSNVTQLALRVELVYDQSNNKTWWGTPGEQSKDWIGGNEKTESVWNLLQVRKRLSS